MYALCESHSQISNLRGNKKAIVDSQLGKYAVKGGAGATGYGQHDPLVPGRKTAAAGRSRRTCPKVDIMKSWLVVPGAVLPWPAAATAAVL